MAKLIIDGQEYNVEDGSKIASFCAEAGVLFNCNTGVCGSCIITVLEGNENLNELTPEEEDLGLDGVKRLACMCIIRGGTVVLKSG